jgi:hypothetical protein
MAAWHCTRAAHHILIPPQTFLNELEFSREDAPVG